MSAPTIRWDDSRGTHGQWDLRGLGPDDLRLLRNQITVILRGDVTDGGVRCTCFDVLDANPDQHIHGCLRLRVGT